MPQYPEGKPPYDPFTVAGFILAFLFPPVGLPLSIIGIRNTHDGLKRSEGLAIAGVAISACSLLLFLSSLHGKALIIAGVIIAIIAGVPCLMLLPKSKKSQGWDGGNAGNMNVGGMVAPPYAQQPAPPVAPTAVAPPMAPPDGAPRWRRRSPPLSMQSRTRRIRSDSARQGSENSSRSSSGPMCRPGRS